MFINIRVTQAERELEYQRAKWHYEDLLKHTTVDQIAYRMEQNSIGELQVFNLPIVFKLRNAVRRIATLQNLLRQYRK